MSAISGEFAEWVLERCQDEAGGELVLGESLFDERDFQLGERVKLALGKGLRVAAAVSVPRLERVDRRSADETVQRCTVEVGIVRSALSPVDSLGLAERLYMAFSGADWQPAGGFGIGCCDVAADGLRTEVTSKAMSHSFEVSAMINI